MGDVKIPSEVELNEYERTGVVWCTETQFQCLIDSLRLLLAEHRAALGPIEAYSHEHIDRLQNCGVCGWLEAHAAVERALGKE